MFSNKETTISIKEARKILGKYSKQLTDTQILDIITTLSLLAKKYMCYNGSKKDLGKSNE